MGLSIPTVFSICNVLRVFIGCMCSQSFHTYHDLNAVSVMSCYKLINVYLPHDCF